MSSSTTAIIQNSSNKAPLLSDSKIREIADGPPTDIAQWVHSTASEQGISVRHRLSDRFAREVSRLSDAEIDLDPVEELLIALSRAQVITQHQRNVLQVHYLSNQMSQTR